MADDSTRHVSGLSSPDPAVSEGNSSVQVNVDSLSNRGRSTGRRSHSPSARLSRSRGSEPSLARRATNNSLSSFLSSQPSSSEPSLNDQQAREDVLRGLIDCPGASTSGAASGTQHGVKRPHDDEAADEPLAKRDKLGEELERMFAAHPAQVSVTVSLSTPAILVSATATSSLPDNGTPALGSEDVTANIETQNTLPMRPLRRRQPHMANGTAMSRNGIPEASEPSTSGEDESEYSSGC